MAGHLNIFHPYERKGAGHEDALTRAFLLVLRGVPVAHAAWLDLVDQAHRTNHGTGVPHLHELPAPQVHMQTARVPPGVRRVISLVQTDAQVFSSGDALPSDRRQVLDGVVAYDQLAVVVENKPWHGDIWEGQLHVNVPKGVAHDPRVATVTWTSIVLAWGRLLEAGHLGTAEAVLLGDFLEYVETHFPRLRPFSKVGLCGHDTDRLHRRCRGILEAIAPGHASHHRGWGHRLMLAPGQCALMIGLFPRTGADGPEITVEIDPGDTMGQAKKLYRRVDPAGLRHLADQGWKIAPNLHVAHMTVNLVHTHTSMVFDDYWRLWAEGSPWLRQWHRPEFGELLALLIAEGLADERDRPGFDKHVFGSKRRKLNLCPGVHMQWRLPVDEAAVLDARGTLEARVCAAMTEGAEVLGLSLPF